MRRADPHGHDPPDALPAGRTIAEAIASALGPDITTGRLPAGVRLRQVKLANRFDVSTTPVREAFAILQHEGLVRTHPQSGATVLVPSVDDLHEHDEIRAALEALAVARAAANFTPGDATPLEASREEMSSCPNAERYIELNHQFHMTLYRLARRKRLVGLITQLRTASDAYLQIYAAEGVPSPRLDREHREILEACKARDPERAARAIRDHLAQTVEHVTNDLAVLAADERPDGGA